jgi:hypothetical protein
VTVTVTSRASPSALLTVTVYAPSSSSFKKPSSCPLFFFLLLLTHHHHLLLLLLGIKRLIAQPLDINREQRVVSFRIFIAEKVLGFSLLSIFFLLFILVVVVCATLIRVVLLVVVLPSGKEESG